MKKYVVGDIHGGYKALVELLEKSPFNIQEDVIIFLGDYTDGWKHSWEVINHLIEIKEVMGDRAIFLRGNHDIWAENYLKWEYVNVNWVMNRGGSTILSYHDKDSTGHLEFFEGLLDYYLDEDNNLFVHAGIKYSEDDLEKAATSITSNEFQYCHWDREMVKHFNYLYRSKPEDTPLLLPQYKNIFVGHTPTQSLKLKSTPFIYQNLNVIDTGAGWGGPLTIMDVDTKEFWQSEPLDKLYKK